MFDSRRTTILDIVDPPYTNPNGNRSNSDGCVHDDEINAKEAGLWLLSQASRSAGGTVHFDPASERWRVGQTGLTEKKCAECPKIFQPTRITALYCSAACRKKASRKTQNVTLTGRWVSQ